MYVCKYKNLCTRICASFAICIYIYTYTHTQIFVCVFTYSDYLSDPIYLYLHCIHVYIYIYICMYVCMYVCNHARAYVYVHMYTYIYIYIYILVCTSIHHMAARTRQPDCILVDLQLPRMGQAKTTPASFRLGATKRALTSRMGLMKKGFY